MDFLDPNKKHSHKIRLYIGYALMTIAISLGAVILLYAAFGYSVDRSGNVFQNGLVFLASTPDAAEVKISNDDETRKQTAITSERLVLPADTYNFEFLKEGYKPWQRTIELKGGGIQRLVYPFLFPEEFKPEDRSAYAARPGLTTVTPDRSTILVQRPNAFLEFDVYDANDPKKASTAFSLPSGLLSNSSKSQKLELLEWSTNNRHFIAKHSFDGKTEFILIDHETPDESLNINAAFKVNPKSVLFRDKNPDQLYIHLSDKTLQTADVSERSVQTALKNVEVFQPHGSDMLLYVAKDDSVDDNEVGVFMLTGEETFKIRELPEDTTYLIDLARYNDSWLVAAGSSKDDRIYIYRNPITFIKSNPDNPLFSIRTMRINNPQYISFSANTQFLVAQAGQSFNVYDALDDRQYHFKIETAFDKGSGEATWMDGHRLLTVTDGKVTVFDFDGSNYQVLTPITVGTVPMLDSEYESLYAIAPSVETKNRTALVRTPLRLESN